MAIRGERGPELVTPRGGTLVRVTERSTRADIAEAIAALMRKRARLPVHYIDQRREIMDEVEGLVDRWLEARG